MGLLQDVDNKHRVLAIIFFAIGLLLTLLTSFTLKYVGDSLVAANHKSQLVQYSNNLSENFQNRTRFLGPLAGTISIENNPQRPEIIKGLQSSKETLKYISRKDIIVMSAFVPRWIGETETMRSQIIAENETEQEKVSDYIQRNLTDWAFFLSRTHLGESVLLGLDSYNNDQMHTMVVGFPIFEKDIQANAVQGVLPVGFIMVWLDLDVFLKRLSSTYLISSEDVRICIRNGTTTRSCIQYEKGHTIVADIKGHLSELTYTDNQSHQFHWAGREVVVSLTEQAMSQSNGWAKFYFLILSLGILFSAFLGLIFLKLGKKIAPPHHSISLKEHDPASLKSGSQIERVVRNNKARWEYVMETLPIALFAIDDRGTFSWAEGKGLSALGLISGPLEGQSAYEFFAQNEMIIKAINDCLDGHEQNAIYSIKGAWIDMRLSPVLKNDGNMSGLIGMASDVSREYTIRDRLDKTNMHLQAVLDNLPVCVSFVRDGKFEWVSQNMASDLGFAENELCGLSPEIIYADPNRFYEVSLKAKDVLQQAGTYQDRIQCRRKDGTRFLGEITGNLIDAHDVNAGSLWVFHDLTDNLKNERAKRLSKTVYDNLIEGIIVTDENNEIVSVNKAFSLITGYELEEVIGRAPSVLSSGRHDPAFFMEMWEEIHSKGSWSGEFWNRRKNGDTYLQRAMITSLQDEQGNIQEYVAVFSDITRDRQNQEQLLYQASYDLLTGLPNRHLLADRFNQAVAWAKREDKNFAVVYLDLDNFKYYNESFGHESGDKILKILAERISAKIREFDTVARIGGDEFVLLLMGADQQDEITRIIAMLSFELSHPIALTNHKEEIILSATCGISTYPKDGETFAELSRKADTALYHAKETERGIFLFFVEDMNKRARERIMLENRLRKAIDSEEFVLYFQPKVDLETGEIHGAESLIRWIDPEMGIIGPNKFIPIAEETGQIVSIGEWVFKTACQQMKKWQDQGLGINNLAINLSGRQFLKPDLVDGMLKTINDIGVDPKTLELEITESFIANSEQTTSEALEKLSAIGVKLSVDDFGTGYSSLSYLHRFPLDLMKIDRSFIIEIEDERDFDAGKIAKAVIAIAKSMDLAIVGEGVENEHQLKFLRDNGCDLIQGYYYSKPLPGEAFEALVKSGKNLYIKEPDEDENG